MATITINDLLVMMELHEKAEKLVPANDMEVAARDHALAALRKDIFPILAQLGVRTEHKKEEAGEPVKES